MKNFFPVLRLLWNKFIPNYIRKRLYFYRSLGGYRYQKELNQRALDVGKKDKIRILFIATTLPMWRYQGIYDLLKSDSRFEVRVIITPFARYSFEEAFRQSESLKKYFLSKDVSNFISVIDNDNGYKNWLDEFAPHMIFPSQHYNSIYGNKLDIEHNTGKLMAYIPYGTPTMKDQFVYNTEFHNKAWRVYHATKWHLKTSRRLMANNAMNVRIVGEVDYDTYLESNSDPWKILSDGKKRKRIIWAPHFTISNDNLLHRASFLWLCDDMLSLAKKYKDLVQFVFKPHPHLFITLVKNSDWGRKKTEWYYNEWATMANTQLSEGEFVDLFKFSDALIHDCGSFTGEYMMTGNPVMFITRDKDYLFGDADDFGVKCLEQHYFGQTIHDVERFIDEVVISGNDEMSTSRNEFRRDAFHDDNITTAERIYTDILGGLGLE